MKKKLFNFKKGIMLLVLVLTHLSLWAQNVSISGVVSDVTGEAIPGVSVVEKGTTNGSITDI